MRKVKGKWILIVVLIAILAPVLIFIGLMQCFAFQGLIRTVKELPDYLHCTKQTTEPEYHYRYSGEYIETDVELDGDDNWYIKFNGKTYNQCPDTLRTLDYTEEIGTISGEPIDIFAPTYNEDEITNYLYIGPSSWAYGKMTGLYKSSSFELPEMSAEGIEKIKCLRRDETRKITDTYYLYDQDIIFELFEFMDNITPGGNSNDGEIKRSTRSYIDLYLYNLQYPSLYLILLIEYDGSDYYLNINYDNYIPLPESFVEKIGE